MSRDRLEIRGTQAILYPAEGGVMFLTASQLTEYRETGEVTPYQDPGLEGLRVKGERTALIRVDSPDYPRGRS